MLLAHPEIFDGVRLRKGPAVAVVRHNARVMLACERVILNVIQRMSGIATATRNMSMPSPEPLLDPRYPQDRLRAFALSTNTPFAAAAEQIIASIFPTACSSRTITLHSPAE